MRILTVAACLLSVAAPAWASRGAAAARTARVLSVRDEGHLHYIHSSGNEIIDEGRATGTLPGTVRAYFTYDGEPTVTAKFEIYGSGWSISGHGAGRLSNPNSTTPSFRGSLTLSGGSGRYAHAHGSGEMFGVYDRRSYGLTVQTIGSLHY
jgi:hypothetical protein